MARPYSDDLRRKLLEAHDLGKGSRVGGSVWREPFVGVEDFERAEAQRFDQAEVVPSGAEDTGESGDGAAVAGEQAGPLFA